MAKVSTNVSIDADIKKQAQELFAELGMDLSTAINIFIRQALRQHSIPFEITADPFYNAENMAELERRIHSVRTGQSLLKEHELIEVDDE